MMNEQEHEMQEKLVQRVEDLANVLQESSVGELELTEDGTEIIIKRQSEVVISSVEPQVRAPLGDVKTPQDLSVTDRSIPLVAPLTGVLYMSPSPSLPPFIAVGDIIGLEQVVALIEAMKVFNEVRADVAGRVTQIVAQSGLVVKKGEPLFRVEPL